jgi:uncharacterized protein
MRGPIALIVKATRLCNLRCSYCHDWRTGRDQIMPFDVLATMTARALQEPEHVEFIWHGGEPTILPISFYERAVLVQARLKRVGQTVKNSFQTNGTRITKDWVRFFLEFQFDVGVSLDGPSPIHDLQRSGASGQPSFSRVLASLDLLRENDIPLNVLMVISQETLKLGPDRIFDFFLEHKIPNYGLIAAKPVNAPDARAGTPTKHYVDPEAMSGFLIRLYDRWLEHGDPNIHIRELDAIQRRVLGQEPGFCTLAGGCLGQYFLVEPNGEIAHCDLFDGDERYTLGNIMTDRFSSLCNGFKMAQLRKKREHELNSMKSCPEFTICQGWCPHERYLAMRHYTGYRSGCCGLDRLIQHVRVRMAQHDDHVRSAAVHAIAL